MQVLFLGVALRVVEVDNADPVLVGRGSASEVGKEVGKRRGWFVDGGSSPRGRGKWCGRGRRIRPCEFIG